MISPNLPPQSKIATVAAAGVLTTGLLGIQNPIENGTVKPGEPYGQQEGSVAAGVLHPGSPAYPSEVIREDKTIPPTTSHLKKALEISFGPGSSFIDPVDKKILNGIPQIIDDLVKQGKKQVPNGKSKVTVTGTGMSSDYISNPMPPSSSSFNKKEPEVGKPQLDWSKERAEAGGKATDAVLQKAGIPITTDIEHAQNVLSKEQLARFNEKAKNLGATSAQEFTTEYLRGNITGHKADKLYWNFVGSKMKYEVVIDNKITTPPKSINTFKRVPGIPGTPDDIIVGYNTIPAAFPNNPRAPIVRDKNPRWNVPEIGKPKSGNPKSIERIKQPRFGKERFSPASRAKSGSKGRRGHSLRGQR